MNSLLYTMFALTLFHITFYLFLGSVVVRKVCFSKWLNLVFRKRKIVFPTPCHLTWCMTLVSLDSWLCFGLVPVVIHVSCTFYMKKVTSKELRKAEILPYFIANNLASLLYEYWEKRFNSWVRKDFRTHSNSSS